MNGTLYNHKLHFFVAIVLLVFLALYFVIASLHGLGMDESYYGRGAQYFADGNYLLQKFECDKPPLIFQVLGLSLALFGRTAMALKVPNAIALALLLLLTFAIAKKFFGQAAGLFAIVLMATSPYVAQVGIGAMTDPLATLLLIASLYSAISGRTFLSGFLLGLSLCTRQTSFLFLPISLVAIFLNRSDKARPYDILKRFVFGLAIPLTYLLVWSTFFEKPRFYWLFHGFTSGKVVEGKQLYPLTERLSFWSYTMFEYFFSSYLFWGIALLCSIIFALIVLGKRNGERIKPAQQKILLLFVGIIIYYLTCCVLVGFPLYRRLIFPLLPVFAVLVSLVVIQCLAYVPPLQKPVWKKLGFVILAALLILGTAQNARFGAELFAYDDLPEAAEFIKQIPQEKKFVVSKEWGRHLHFFLHGSSVKYKNARFKLHVENALLKMMESYPEYAFLLMLPTEELFYLPRIERLVSPLFSISQIDASSRGLIQTFEIKPRAQIAHKDHRPYLILHTDSGERLVSITPDDINAQILAYAKNSLKSYATPEVTVERHLSLPIEDGYLGLVRFHLPEAELQNMPCKDMTIEYKNLKIDLVKLFTIQQFVVQKAQKKRGKLAISEQALESFIQKKNPNLKDVRLTVTDDELEIAGQFSILNKRVSFVLSISIYVDENGWVNLRLKNGKLGKLSVPTLFLKILEGSINPAFVPKSEALGLRCSSLEIEQGQIRLFLESPQKNYPVNKPR